MIFDSVIDELANLFVDLVHFVPSLSRIPTVVSILSLEVKEGVEMADTRIGRYYKLSDSEPLQPTIYYASHAKQT